MRLSSKSGMRAASRRADRVLLKSLGRDDDQRNVLRRKVPVHLWQFVVAMLIVEVIVLAINGVWSVGEALVSLASGALVGYAAFHLCAALTGVRWKSHLI